MQIHREGALTFEFEDHWKVTKYDAWAFYRNQFQNCCDNTGGNKAIDFILIDSLNKVLWLLEVKDYRQNPRTKSIDPWDEVAQKARDTLAGLYVAAVNDGGVEGLFAVESRKMGKLRIVLHFEQPAKHSKLFPRAFNPDNIQQKLKTLVKAIDPHPRVVEISTAHKCGWNVH